jgi:hypothetical protein
MFWKRHEMTNVVPVDLGDRSYQVRIGPGLIDRAGAEIAPLLRRPRVAVVTDETVAARQLPRLQAALSAAGIAHDRAGAAARARAPRPGPSLPAASNGCWSRRSSAATWWWRLAAG